MFWISYSVTFVLASVAAIALMGIRLVLSAAGRAFALISPLHQSNVAGRRQLIFLAAAVAKSFSKKPSTIRA